MISPRWQAGRTGNIFNHTVAHSHRVYRGVVNVPKCAQKPQKLPFYLFLLTGTAKTDGGLSRNCLWSYYSETQLCTPLSLISQQPKHPNLALSAEKSPFFSLESGGVAVEVSVSALSTPFHPPLVAPVIPPRNRHQAGTGSRP